MSLIGIPLGAFVGILSGFLFLLIIRAGFQSSGLKQIAAILTELTALVSFALGGSWFANSSLLGESAPGEILNHYMLSFSIAFVLVIAFPFYRIVVRFGNQFAVIEQNTPDLSNSDPKSPSSPPDD